MWKRKPKIDVIGADVFDETAKLLISSEFRQVTEYTGCIEVRGSKKNTTIQVFFKVSVCNGKLEEPGFFSCEEGVVSQQAWECAFEIVKNGLKSAGRCC